MSLILIPGPSGCGKSHMLYERVLREAQRNPEGRYIVLVPEQNTLQTQRRLVSMSERGGIWNIDVLSFTRLAFRVFEQTGVARRRILSETGKVLLLRLIAAREGDRIPILSGVLDRPGVLGEMKSILSEMDQYGIGQETLRKMEADVGREGAHPALARKLREISLLQEAFERYQEDHFITGEKLLRVLDGKLALDETLKGATICLDGFTGLTPAQLQVITTLLGIVKDILVTVTIDRNLIHEPDPGFVQGEDDRSGIVQGLFALSDRTIHALKHCARDAHAGVEYLFVPPDTPGRHVRGGELWWLERHLLRAGKEGRKPFPGGGRREIWLRQCADPWDEAVSAAVTISELIRQDVRLRDIAIVCGSLKDYAEYVRRALSVYGIPCYIDRSSTVVMNPAFEFVHCAIGILEKNFSYESVMALLRTSLALDPENGEIDLLDNYILAAGIRGHRMWANPFERQTRDRNQELLDAAEKPRRVFMEKFEPFAQVMKKSRAQFLEYAKALWNLLIAFDLPRKLEAESLRCMEEDREERAQEYESVLRVISGVLDEAVLLMGDQSVTRTQFAEILRAGFSEARIGIVPRGIDQVQVGDLERSRLDNIRVVLFLGLNDGIVPPRRRAGGILTDQEREYLMSQDVHLAPTVRQEADIQQFYLYLTLTRPSQALYLSWSASRGGDRDLRPSGIVTAVRTLFPSAAWAAASSVSPFESVTSPETGKSVLFQALGDYLHGQKEEAGRNEAKLQELICLYLRREERWKRSAQMFLRSICPGRKETDLDEETAVELYGTVLRGSITRLEEFSGCAFRHFADYGLRLREREEFAIRPLDIGVLLHHAAEILSGKLSRKTGDLNWRSIPDDLRDRLASESLKEALEREHGAGLYMDSSRSAETLARCEHIFLRCAAILQRQIRAGEFDPVRVEYVFGQEDPDGLWTEELPGGRKLVLGGKIDRIDECVEEETKKLYLKILDYKSSSNDIDLVSVIEGEQLQLIVYLDAAARILKKKYPDREIVCAGAFYFAFRDPVIEMTQPMTPQELEDAFAVDLRVKGLVNGRTDVIERLDKEPWVSGPSKVIPVTKNKAPGELNARSGALTDRQFGLLRAYAADRMKKTASAILSGKTAPNPSRKSSGVTSCGFCPYRDVCGFDPHEKGSGYREQINPGKDACWEIIESAVSGSADGRGAGPDEPPENSREIALTDRRESGREGRGEERTKDAGLDE